MKRNITIILTVCLIINACVSTKVMNGPWEAPQMQTEYTVTVSNELKGHVLDIHTLKLNYSTLQQEEKTTVVYNGKEVKSLYAGEQFTTPVTITGLIIASPWDMKSMPGEKNQGFATLTCDIYTENNENVKIVESKTPIYIPIKINVTSEDRHIKLTMNGDKTWKYISGTDIRNIFYPIGSNPNIEQWTEDETYLWD